MKIEMGSRASREPTPDLPIPRCATLNFQPSPAEVTSVPFGNLENIHDAMLLVRSLSSVLPLLGMVPTIPAKLLRDKETGNNLLLFLGNYLALSKLFLEPKRSSAKNESALRFLTTKILEIKFLRTRMLHDHVSVDDLKIEAVPVLHSCEKILELFSDQSNCFWSQVIPSSEYVLTFATLYLECLCHVLFLIPSYRDDAARAAENICTVLNLYQRRCVDERMKQIWCHVNPKGPRPDSNFRIVELIVEMKSGISIANKPNYTTTVGDRWPSISTSTNAPFALTSWDRCLRARRGIEDNVIYELECFLDYRRATETMYEAKFDEVINLSIQFQRRMSAIDLEGL